MPIPLHLNWTNKTYIAIGAIVFSILFACSVWILHIVKSGVEDNIRAQLHTIQEATHQTLHYWRNSSREAAIGVANRSIVKHYIEALIKADARPAALRKNPTLSKLRKELAPFILEHGYIGFFVVPHNQINYGSMRDSNLGVKNLLLTKDSQSLLQGFAGETVFSKPIESDVPLKDENGILQDNQYSLFVITPVTNQQDKIIALLMFRIPPVEHFKKILAVGQFGKSGETYIFNEQGMLLSPSRFEIPLMQAGLIRPDSSSAYQLTLRQPGWDITRNHRPQKAYKQQPLTHIVSEVLQGKEHMDLTPRLDYRGVKVVNIGKWDHSEGWGYISQMNYQEAFAIYHKAKTIILLVSAISALLLITLVLSLMNSRRSAIHLVQKRTIQLKQQNQSLRDEIEERKQIEQTLQNTQIRTDAILHSAFDAIIATDEYGCIELINPSAEAMFGYNKDELIGENVRTLMPEPIRDMHDHLIKQHNSGEVSTIVGRRREMVASRKGGSTFPIELAVEETIIDGKKYFTSTINDISGLKDMIEQVSASEREYKSIINNLTDTFFRMDINGSILMVSPSIEDLLVYRAEELLNTNFKSLHVDTNMLEQLINILDHHDSITDYEFQLKRKDGIIIWVSTNAHYYTDDYGNPLGIEGTIRDITSRKQAEEELRESRQRLSFHIKQTPLGVIEWDIDFKAIEWNPAAEQIFGYTRNEAIGRHASELIIPPEYKPHVADIWHALLGQRGGQHSTNQNIDKQGETIWCEWYNTPLVDESMNVIGVASMVMDVTPRKKAEEILARDHEQLQALVEARTDELNLARLEAEQANDAKSEFLANMSHELRTPMHTILSFAEMGMKKADKLTTEKLIQYFTNIYKGGERQLSLLNNLLDLSKLEADVSTYDFNKHDILPLIKEQVAQHELLLNKKQLKVKIEPTPLDTQFCFDRVRIEQVIRNLLSNAIKFSKENKTITIKLSLSEIHQAHNSIPALMLSVTDEGMGIPEAELESVFDKFVQSSKTRTGAGGTGLGLAICQEIIKAHGGNIWAENNKTNGVSFRFTLPLLREKKTNQPPQSKTN